jgi:tetratricopeptide (TPR) repeat protein
MKQIAKLKDEARKFEAREEWEKAIHAYSEVLRLAEGGDSADLDLPLYNRVGDLYVRLGRSAEAVKYYEQAADKYAETGLYNNAIALCNKALRYDAGRVELLKKLGQFSASQGFFTDARRWYLEYCERMSKRGAIDQAFLALSELADLHDNPEIRELLARQLRDHGRAEQAVEEFRRAYALRIAAGQTGEANELRAEILALDPNADVSASAAAASAAAVEPASSYTTELPGFIDIDTTEKVAFDGRHVQQPTPDTAAIHIESPLPDSTGAETPADVDTIDIEPADVGPEAQLETVEPTDLGIEPSLEFTPPPHSEPDAAVGHGDLLDLPTFDLNEFGTDLGGGFDLGLSPPVAAGQDIEEALTEDVEPAADFEPLPGLEDLESGSADRDAIDELPLMETAPEEPLRFSFDEEDAATDQQAFQPPAEPEWIEEFEDVRQRPEAAVPEADALPEVEAAPEPEPQQYAAELPPEPEPEPVFETPAPEEPFEAPVFEEPVFETPAPDEPALEEVVFEAPAPEEPALEEAVFEDSGYEEPIFEEPEPVRFEPEPAPNVRPPREPARATASSDYIDLASFLAEETEASDSTRFVIAEAAPTGDEDQDFADMLKQFKAKVAETIPKEDAGSHYDLGLAFKEMGLLDEAIAEFQTALRGGQEKLKVLEELGNCFVQKQQYSVAVTVLSRALQMPRQDEADFLGVYYNLGRAHEELGQAAEARAAYERVISVDIGFQDTSERLAKL